MGEQVAAGAFEKTDLWKKKKPQILYIDNWFYQ